MTTKLLDYSTWRADVDDIKKLGVVGVIRYLSVINEKTQPKVITKDGAQRLLDGGLSVSLVYEWYVGRPIEGASAGTADVKTAEDQADSINAPLEIPIFYAVDTDTTIDKVRAYFRAINETNKRPVGVYGSYQIVHGLMKEGLVTYGWQTAAWSNGKVCSHAHLIQNVFKDQYDVNDVLKPFPTWIKTSEPDVPDVEEPVVEPEKPAFVKPDAGSKTAWLRVNSRGAKVATGGYWVTTRGLAMYLEASRLYRFYSGSLPPAITQGGRNAGGVAQSAGTHDREAFDFSTKDLTARQANLWELCLWLVGFASWKRQYIAGRNGWPRHDHAVPKGGDLSRGALNQTRDFSNGLDGLVSRRTYSRISKMGVNDWTWEKYLASYAISLPALADAVVHRRNKVDVFRFQVALSCFLGRDVVADGYFGPVTYSELSKVGKLDDALMEKLALPTSKTQVDVEPPKPVETWPKITGDPVSRVYYVDPRKVTTVLLGHRVNDEEKKRRDPGFVIDTPEAIVEGSAKSPFVEGYNKWLKTKAGIYYSLEFLTTEKPVSTRKLKVATWNLYFGNSIAESKKGLKAIVDAGYSAIGVQELSEDADQKALTTYMESLGWKATKRNSAVTSFYDPDVFSDMKESYVVVEKGGRKWEAGAGGNDTIYKIIMMLDGKVKATGVPFALLNHHLVPTVERNGNFRADHPIRVSVFKKQIAVWCAEAKKRNGLVFGTQDMNVAWGTNAGDWVEKQLDAVGVTCCWDEAVDQPTHSSDRTIDWVTVKGGTIEDVEVFPYNGSDHRGVGTTVSY